MNLFTQNIQVEKRCNVVLVKAKDMARNSVLVLRFVTNSFQNLSNKSSKDLIFKFSSRQAQRL